MNQIKLWWNQHPLRCILVVGFAVRLLAAIFSKGYGFSDDHFYVIEGVQSWIDHVDYDNWLPGANGAMRPGVAGHNFFYTGIIYLIFEALKFIGITNPQDKMMVLRLLQVPYSMLTVYYGYKIAYKISTITIAKHVGLLLALLWVFPYLCVRNLVEMVCIPPLIYATWLSVRDEKNSFAKYFIVGVFLGLGFCFRYQAMVFAGGFGLALLFQRKWIPAIASGIGFILCGTLIQGGIDMFIWHRPFVELYDYVNFNAHNGYSFVVLPWYTYVLFFAGILIPPVSIFLLFGYFRNFRKYIILFLPAFLFLVFHSIFPNKRERFILPILPFVIILGYVGWAQFVVQSNFWQKRQALLKGCWIFFWIINTIPLIVISVAYTKRDVVESMTYLHDKGDVVALIVDDGTGSITNLPHYYLGKWVTDYYVNDRTPIDSMYKKYAMLPDAAKPNYVIFFRPDSLDKRIANIRRYHTLKYVTTIQPGFIDKIMHFLNPPFNDSRITYIYRITGTIHTATSVQAGNISVKQLQVPAEQNISN